MCQRIVIWAFVTVIFPSSNACPNPGPACHPVSNRPLTASHCFYLSHARIRSAQSVVSASSYFLRQSLEGSREWGLQGLGRVRGRTKSYRKGLAPEE